jgi:hypothetical protein
MTYRAPVAKRAPSPAASTAAAPPGSRRGPGRSAERWLPDRLRLTITALANISTTPIGGPRLPAGRTAGREAQQHGAAIQSPVPRLAADCHRPLIDTSLSASPGPLDGRPHWRSSPVRDGSSHRGTPVCSQPAMTTESEEGIGSLCGVKLLCGCRIALRIRSKFCSGSNVSYCGVHGSYLSSRLNRPPGQDGDGNSRPIAPRFWADVVKSEVWPGGSLW